MIIYRSTYLFSFLVIATLLSIGSLVGQSSNHDGQFATPAVIHPKKRETITELNVKSILVSEHRNTEATGQIVTIIESQSAISGHIMDQNWLNLAQAMGFQATIHQQVALEDSALLDTSDILIISSGVIDIPVQRRGMILYYLKSGKSIYLQNEYLCNNSSNLLFDELVDSLAGSVTLVGTVSGDLEPMNVIGTLSTTPNLVDTLSYFWYGCNGIGDGVTVIPFLEYQGDYFGFIFTPPNPAHGILITTSDQDWVRNHSGYITATMLMENILFYLAEGENVGIYESTNTSINGFALHQNFPNPFNPSTTIEFSLPQINFVTLKVYNMVGQEMATLVSEKLSAGVYKYDWDASGFASGVYVYKLTTDKGFVQSKKLILLK